VADTKCLRHLDQVFRDAAGEAATVASDGTPVPGHSAAVASALEAAQGPFLRSASAGETIAPGPGSDTPENAPRGESRAVTGSASTVGASRSARPTRAWSRQAAERPRRTEGSCADYRRRRNARRDGSPASSGPSLLPESDHSPSGASSDPGGTEAIDNSHGVTSFAATGSDDGATSRRRLARGARKRPQRAMLQEALRSLRRVQRDDTVVDPRLKELLSLERFRPAQKGGRQHFPRGTSILGIHADLKFLMNTSRQLAGDT